MDINDKYNEIIALGSKKINCLGSNKFNDSCLKQFDEKIINEMLKTSKNKFKFGFKTYYRHPFKYGLYKLIDFFDRMVLKVDHKRKNVRRGPVIDGSEVYNKIYGYKRDYKQELIDDKLKEKCYATTCKENNN